MCAFYMLDKGSFTEHKSLYFIFILILFSFLTTGIIHIFPIDLL